MQIGVESSRSVENKRVFVVDEDEVVRSALQFMLHDENETHEFGDLSAALDRGREWPPDLVILGEAFLSARGVEMIGAVRVALPAAKVLAVAASPDSPLLKAVSAAGVDGVLAGRLTVEGVRRKADVLLGRGAGLMIPLAPLSAKES